MLPPPNPAEFPCSWHPTPLRSYHGGGASHNASAAGFPLPQPAAKLAPVDVAPAKVAHEPSCAFVGLGSNLGDRLALLRSAAEALRDGFAPTTELAAASSVYETRPLGPSDAPFLNAAIQLHTMLSPRSLLEALLALEAHHGRERRRRWEARSLDLDLLLFVPPGGARSLRIDALDLRLPHPELTRRDFVLAPLGELTGPLTIMGTHCAAELLDALPDTHRTIVHTLTDPLLWTGS